MCDSVADIVFVLDSSGSIEISGQGNWNLMLNFLVDIVNRLTIGPNAIRVGVVSYSGQSKVNFLLDEHTNKSELVNAIKRIPYIGDSTNTAAAIEDMRTKVFTQRGDRSNVQNMAIVITDGESNIDQRNTIPNAERAKNDGIIMLAVGITKEINLDELRGISSNGVEGETYWRSSGFGVTEDIVENIVTQTCVVLEAGEVNNKKYNMHSQHMTATCTSCNLVL